MTRGSILQPLDGLMSIDDRRCDREKRLQRVNTCYKNGSCLEIYLTLSI